MELQVTYSVIRQSLWIQRLQRSIIATQAELDRELPSFEAIEEEYKKWKMKIDVWKTQIASDKEELAMFEHAMKFPNDKIHKPRLVNQYTGEPVQQQVVKQKKGYDKDGLKPLPHIKWEKIIVPLLKEFGHFMKASEIWKVMHTRNIFLNDLKINRRLTVACATDSLWLKIYRISEGRHSYVGLPEWFDKDGVPKQQFLKNFIGKEAV